MQVYGNFSKLNTLKKYVIRGKCFDLIKSYLNDRIQIVNIKHGTNGIIEEYSSNPIPTQTGVLQGSILGPLLFIIMPTTSAGQWIT